MLLARIFQVLRTKLSRMSIGLWKQKSKAVFTVVLITILCVLQGIGGQDGVQEGKGVEWGAVGLNSVFQQQGRSSTFVLAMARLRDPYGLLNRHVERDGPKVTHIGHS